METLTRKISVTRQRTARSAIMQNAVIRNEDEIKNDAVIAMGLIQQKSFLLGLNQMSLNEINDKVEKARQYPCRMTENELRLEVMAAEKDYANGMCITHEELLKEEEQRLF